MSSQTQILEEMHDIEEKKKSGLISGIEYERKIELLKQELEEEKNKVHNLERRVECQGDMVNQLKNRIQEQTFKTGHRITKEMTYDPLFPNQTKKCPICTEKFKPGQTIVELACLHMSCVKCNNEWGANLMKKGDVPKCSLCRQTI